MNVITRALRARRTQIRQAVERVPVFGTVTLSLFRAGRRALAARRAVEDTLPDGRFLALYRHRTGIEDLAHIVDPVRRMHTDFALSTVKRGRVAIGRIGEHTTIEKKRCLDVGCAYGGFLVAFAQAGASRVVGIDINQNLLDYADALLADYRIRAEVKNLDILASDRASELGRFDIVTCNDVIEHVADPAKALAQLVSLLADDGVLYMEIPNRFYAPFVRADGHFQIFGITALPKREADRYYAETHPGGVHDVTYKSLPFYVNTLARLGASVEIISHLPVDLPGNLANMARVFEDCERTLEACKAELSPSTRRSLTLHLGRTARAFQREHARFSELSSRNPGAAAKIAERTYLSFGLGFWTLIIRRARGTEARRTSWSKGLKRGTWGSSS